MSALIIRTSLVIVLCAGVAPTSLWSGTVFKCTDSNGHIFFSDQPCVAEKTEELYLPEPKQPPPVAPGDDGRSDYSRTYEELDEYSYGGQSCQLIPSSWERHVAQYEYSLDACGEYHDGRSVKQMKNSLKILAKWNTNRQSDYSKQRHAKEKYELNCRISLIERHKRHGKNEWLGHICIENCGGHSAGYNWASENDISDCSSCFGTPPSPSFTEGCMVYVSTRNGSY